MEEISIVSILLSLAFFLLGCIIGSFLNEAAIRVLKKESIVTVRSKPVSLRYLFGELCTGLLFALVYAVIGIEPELFVGLWLICILVNITQTDLEQMIIPNSIVITGLIGAIGLRAWVHPHSYWNYFIAMFVGSGILLLLGWSFEKLVKREAMGGGDIKLYTFIGILLGIQLTLLSLFVASILGLLYGFIQFIRKQSMMQREIPFGPFIAGGSILVYLWGEDWLNWYLNVFIGNS